MLDLLLSGAGLAGVELLALDYPGLERRVMREKLNGTHFALDRFHSFLPLLHNSNLADI
jgi:hypothetical protein